MIANPQPFPYRSLHCPCGAYGFYAYRDAADGRLFFRCMHCFLRLDIPEGKQPASDTEAAIEAAVQREHAAGEARRQEIKDPLGSTTPLHYPAGSDTFRE